jgi:phytanoyl-CoA hydroxylase
VHYHGPDISAGINTDRCQIIPGQIPVSEAVPVPIPAGGAMFFYGMLPHQTPPNTSPGRRRALQYHFRSADSKIIPTEEYFQIFAAADGTPASCKAAMQSGF